MWPVGPAKCPRRSGSFVRQSVAEFWGAHAFSVLVAAFCGDELCFDSTPSNERRSQKFAIAECDRQHARGVRSPERCLRRSELNGSLAAYEKFSRSTPFARHLGARANAIAKASLHVRRHDETEARRRTGAVAGWQMGRVRLRRCRSGSEHEDFAFVDRAGERR